PPNSQRSAAMSSSSNSWRRRARQADDRNPHPPREDTTMSNTIEIPVDIQHNTVICGRNGGNARGCREDRIVWSSRSPHAEFTLRFFPLGLENAGATEL